VAQVASLTDPVLPKQDVEVVSRHLFLCIKQKSSSAAFAQSLLKEALLVAGVSNSRLYFKKINPSRLNAVEKRTEKHFQVVGIDKENWRR